MILKFVFAVLIATPCFSMHLKVTSPNRTSLLFVADIVKDWTQKHSISNNVVVLNTGQTSEPVSFFLKHITKIIPTVLVNASDCKHVEGRESFVIISSHVFNAVSLINFVVFVV